MVLRGNVKVCKRVPDYVADDTPNCRFYTTSNLNNWPKFGIGIKKTTKNQIQWKQKKERLSQLRAPLMLPSKKYGNTGLSRNTLVAGITHRMIGTLHG